MTFEAIQTNRFRPQMSNLSRGQLFNYRLLKDDRYLIKSSRVLRHATVPLIFSGCNTTDRVLECPGKSPLSWNVVEMSWNSKVSWKITTVLEKCPGKWINRIKL